MSNLNRKIISIFFLLLFCASSASAAIKIRELPFVSDFHIGLVTGVGGGINLGFDAGFKLGNLMLGPEIEQVITDVNYSSSVNATRIGGFLNIEIFKYVFLNVHMGKFNFQVKNRDINYDLDGQNYFFVAGSNSYPGTYQAVSVDLPWQEYMLSPKLIINQIDNGGTLTEFDFNIGRSF